MVHGVEVERNNRACRRCDENLLHLAVACSKSLPSVSYWSQQLDKNQTGRKRKNELQRHLLAEADNAGSRWMNGEWKGPIFIYLTFMRHWGPNDCIISINLLLLSCMLSISNQHYAIILIINTDYYILCQCQGYLRTPASVIDNKTTTNTQLWPSAFPSKTIWELVDSDQRIACTSSNGHLCRKIKH